MAKLQRSLVAMGIALALVSCARQTPPQVAVPQAVGGSDQALLVKMAHHHWEAQRMTLSCKEKARRPELLAFCNALLAEHQQTLEAILSFLRQWHGRTLKVEESPAHDSEQYRAFRDEMRSSAGDEFEEAFLRAMRVHHRLGLQDARACKSQATRQELKEFCENQAAAHEKELSTFSQFLCKWFKDCIG